MTIISENLFRRHRGTRGENAHETTRNDPPANDQENTSGTENGETSNNNNITMTSLNRHDVENPLDGNDNENNASINEEGEENDDEVQELVIRIPSNNNHTTNESSIQFPNWTLNEE